MNCEKRWKKGEKKVKKGEKKVEKKVKGEKQVKTCENKGVCGLLGGLRPDNMIARAFSFCRQQGSQCDWPNSQVPFFHLYFTFSDFSQITFFLLFFTF